jgi:hypothetical protein
LVELEIPKDTPVFNPLVEFEMARTSAVFSPFVAFCVVAADPLVAFDNATSNAVLSELVADCAADAPTPEASNADAFVSIGVGRFPQAITPTTFVAPRIADKLPSELIDINGLPSLLNDLSTAFGLAELVVKIVWPPGTDNPPSARIGAALKVKLP